MRKGAVTSSVLVILVSLAALSTVGYACNQVPFLRWDEACLKACATAALYNLCQETLQHAPDAAEASVYALLAARFAGRSYDDSAGAAERLLAAGSSVPAYRRCVDSCDLWRLRYRYADAAAAVESCGKGLAAGAPLAAMNAADRDRTVVASGLGALIVGK
ncbi:hypothetical protein PAHAL_6G029300 [Panicum hallii]|uniref:Pectinesterase inhibitor domain-containing protein n=1 Tax=Panicum hallii TaxID=206008 RepID=A0A2T8IEY5_9POAL|nr:hypothetical protein PAHAL_6G029300 [Panicum hallii]